LNAKTHLYRLKTATPAEIIYRIRQAWQVHRLRNASFRNEANPSPSALVSAGRQSLPLPTVHGDIKGDDIRAILAGKKLWLGTPIERINAFEKTVRHRYFADIDMDGRGPDIRAVWEPARLQHLTVLTACLKDIREPGKRAAIQAFVRKEILGWIRDNPFLHGPHYLSAMECGLRLPVFLRALQSVERFSLAEKDIILTAIHQHAWWIRRRLSLYASLGNHTICECIGLLFAGAVFQRTPHGREWIGKGIDLLDKEIDHQILPDGGPVEQSFSYHRFVLDLYWLVSDFINANRLGDVSRWKTPLTAGEHFLSAFAQSPEGPPAIGDADDGRAVASGLSPARPAFAPPTKGAVHFPHAGYSVFRGQDWMMAIDHGPLGMDPLYNHGHSDALSVLLWRGEKSILVDPGTYRYNGEPEWRRYFKGTRAHNTVTVDARDQAVQAGSFIWRRPYTCHVADFRNSAHTLYVDAWHDGYARLSQPVFHRRTLQADADALIIIDRFSGAGDHEFELNFHLHPDVVVEKKGHGWMLRNGQARCIIGLSNDLGLKPVRGQMHPIRGWYSPAYGAKQPTTTLSCVRRGRPEEIVFKTMVGMI
jgi:hypothetical protein